MSSRRIRRRIALVVAPGAIVATVAGLLLAPTAFAGESPPPSFSGTIHFGSPTGVRTCVGGVPRSVSISVPYDAADLGEVLPVEFSGSFVSSDYGTQVQDPVVSATVKPGATGTLTETFTVPKSARGLALALLSLQSGGWTFAAQDFQLACAANPPLADPSPTVTAHFVCGGEATLTFDTTASQRTWYEEEVNTRGGFSLGDELAPGTIVTKDVGPTSGLSRFGVRLYTVDQSGDVDIASIGADGGIYDPPTCAAPTQLHATPVLASVNPLHLYLFRLTAKLTSNGVAVPGQSITFTAGKATLCTSKTATSGVAACQVLLPLSRLLALLSAGSNYTATFAGTAAYQASSSTAPLIA